jgi:Cu/Ag efflux protein CusF
MKHGLMILALLAAAGVALTSCSSPAYGPIDDKTQGTTYEKGVPGGTVVESYTITATVSAIDAASRKLTLVAQDGKKQTVSCGPDAVNFDQIHVGDRVKVQVADELTVAMANAATPPGTTSTTALVALAPKGAKPAGLMVETQQYTATITAIDLKRRKVTLHFPDDSTRTFVVRQDVDLSQRKVGEAVAFQVTLATAISVEKP